MLLSLIEKSVRVIPLDKAEWEARGRLNTTNSNSDDDDTLATSITTTDTFVADPNKSIPPPPPDPPLVYPSMSSLRKACLASTPSNAPLPGASMSPTSRNNRKTLNRKTLIATVEKWIMQNHSKAQKKKASPCVKVLSSSRLREESGADSTDPKHILDTYVRIERASDPSLHDRTKKGLDKLICAILPARDPSRSLVLRCNNTLVDGEVYSETSEDGVVRNNSNQSLMSTQTGANMSSSPSRTAILRCAASLYYRLWYFRTIRKRDLRRVFGFALASSVSGSGNRSRVSLRVTFLMLEKPSDSGLNSPPIGGRYPLYVYKKRYDLPRGREKDTSEQPSSSESLPSFSSTCLEELAEFLYHQTESLPCPFKHTSPLDDVLSAPGGMLLPNEPFHKDTGGSTRSSSSLLSAIPMHLDGCSIVPTISGSLVIFCRNARAVRELLQRSMPGDGEREEDREGFRELVKSFTTVAMNGNHASSWYVKYKTPSFGFVWKNSRTAINGARAILLRKQQSRSSSKSSQKSSVRRWTFLHPLDSWVGSYRNITITRSAGISFEKAIHNYDLNWATFKREFLGLAKSTLELQSRFNSLVHGDIHEGNVLYYPPFHNEEGEEKINEDGRNDDSESLFPAGRRLLLIDWDEASRPKPFRRSALTAEERMRYPDNLVDHPKQYTQQQLMHLFANMSKHYFPAETKKVISGEDAKNPDIAWFRDLLVPPSPPSSRMSTTTPYHQSSFAKFLSRSEVEKRYKAMLRGLQGESWWTMNWEECGLDDGSYHLPKSHSSRRLLGGSKKHSSRRLLGGSHDKRKSTIW